MSLAHSLRNRSEETLKTDLKMASRSPQNQGQQPKLIDYTKVGRRRSLSPPASPLSDTKAIENEDISMITSNKNGMMSPKTTKAIQNLSYACNCHEEDGTAERVEFLLKIPSKDSRRQRVNTRETRDRLRNGEGRRRSLKHTSGIIERACMSPSMSH